MPGSLVSRPKIGSPWTIFGLSMPPILRPMMVKSLASLSLTLFGSGTGQRRRSVASSP